eukprot:sb/3462306/
MTGHTQMDDLSIAANFWGLEDPPSSFKMKLPNSKDLSRFQTSQDVSHTTCITINESKFRVNSLVLAQHSEVFEKLIWSGETEITLSRELFVSHMEDAIYVAILFLHGKEITVDQKVLELCFMFASCYNIDALRDMSIGQFVSGITDGSSFFQSFYRLVEIDNQWSDELLVKLILIPEPANNILGDIKNQTPKLIELCQRLENRPTPLGKFLWFLQKNRSLTVQQFKQMRFLSKYLTSTGEEADTVQKFLIHIAKVEVTGPTRAPHKQGSLGSVNSSPALSITSEESSSLNDPGSEREAVPVVFSNSYDAVKFFQQQMWKHIRKIDDYIAYGQAVSELCKPDNPYALFLYIDSFFIWFLRVPTWRMNEGIRNKFLASFYHELLPAAVVQDIENVLDSMMRKSSNRPLPSNCSKELSYLSLDIDSIPELMNRLTRDQKLTVMVPKSFSVQIDFRRDPFKGRIATTRPIGNTIRFFYLISKGRHGESRWMSLAGTSAEKVVNFLQKSTSVAVVLILPKGKQEVNKISIGKQESSVSSNASDKSIGSRRVVSFHNSEQVIDFIVRGLYRDLSSFDQFIRLISAAIKHCGGDMTTYLCVEAMIEWNRGGAKVDKDRLMMALQNTDLECTFLDDVFDELFGVKSFVSSLGLFFYSQNTFTVEIARVKHPLEHIKKSRSLPFIQNSVKCEVCTKTHDFYITIQLDAKDTPLGVDGPFSCQTRNTHLENIRHYYIVIVRVDGSFVRVPIGLKTGTELLQIVETEMGTVPEFWLNVVYNF